LRAGACCRDPERLSAKDLYAISKAASSYQLLAFSLILPAQTSSPSLEEPGLQTLN